MAACRMTEYHNEHEPVLMTEVLNALDVRSEGIYIDATFGRGGHSSMILNQLGPQGKLFAFDKDPEAIAYAQNKFSHDQRFHFFHASFAELKDKMMQLDLIAKVDSIFFDLGVSSPQLDNANRGFSFMRSGKLDMRMDNSKGEDAATWLARVDEQELADVLWTYGEERFSRRIAKAIVAKRKLMPIETTQHLVDVIEEAIPFKEKHKHPATRSFQAIRIYINKELEDLEQGLAAALDILKVGGKLVVISFHSLEDRLVKNFIQHHERGENFPKGLAVKFDQIHARMKRVGSAIKPSDREIAANPRARSAVLRIAEKLI